MAARSMRAVTTASNSHDDVCQERFIHAEHVQVVRQSLLGPEEASTIATLFSVLGDPTRLRLVSALRNSPTSELCVCDLSTVLERDDTTISHQLRVLRNQHIVEMRKVGRVVYYRLVDEHVCLLFDLALTHTHELPLLLSEKEKGVVA